MICVLLAQFVQNIWIESYDPTIEDSYRKVIEVDVSILSFLLRLGMEVETHDHDANAAFCYTRDDNACWRCEFILPSYGSKVTILIWRNVD